MILFPTGLKNKPISSVNIFLVFLTKFLQRFYYAKFQVLSSARWRVVLASVTNKVRNPNPRSAGQQQLAVSRLITAPDLLTPYVVRKHSKFQGLGCGFPQPDTVGHSDRRHGPPYTIMH